MIKATHADKATVVDILSAAFRNNKSVLYIVKQDAHIVQRIRKMMGYSFDKCLRCGEVFLSDDKNACALFILPGKNKSSVLSLLADIRFIFTVTGLSKLRKMLQREKRIAALHPGRPFYYLWFLGVRPGFQGKGTGTSFFKEVLQHYHQKDSLVCLETSTEKNIPWYEKFGFRTYSQLNLGYPLFFMQLENYG